MKIQDNGEKVDPVDIIVSYPPLKRVGFIPDP